MDPRLLEYYTHELLYMRALALEFAEQHPKIAARLGLQAGEIGDPYVERLVQASSFVNARPQMRLDAAFPELMQPMLETVYPNYVRQTPSIGVARLYPGHESGHLGQGFFIPRGTAFTSHTPAGENTPCIFRSSQDVTVYPLRIRLARVTLIPPDIPSLDRYVADGQPVHGAVRLRLQTTNGAPIASLAGLDRLPVYLAGDERIASHLFELIHSAGVASVMAAPGRFAEGPLYGVTRGAVVHEGIAPDQAVLPDVPRRLHGHGLVQEYFASPARFWFFALTGLAKGLKAIEGNAVEIVILLNRAPGALADTVDASHLALFCTPVVNLFPLRTKNLPIDPDQPEHRLVPVPDAPADFDLRSVDVAHGQVAEEGNGGPVFGRGIECEFTFDESGFDGMSPYTLALVLEHYVARHVSMNSFTASVLHSKQRGLIAQWPSRMGTRGTF